ncbi:hypothetical protein AVEN_89701-1 [Araneus ventricosus]|uniref:Uncharacterized protein n=1 Tax=Araneus ventricosus TaxID=182803 RepID=A0A4Y2UGC0_ARAVE|nr:hypothetical protein AVEN_89701-1 [Araneus ventricosus]
MRTLLRVIHERNCIRCHKPHYKFLGISKGIEVHSLNALPDDFIPSLRAQDCESIQIFLRRKTFKDIRKLLYGLGRKSKAEDSWQVHPRSKRNKQLPPFFFNTADTTRQVTIKLRTDTVSFS